MLLKPEDTVVSNCKRMLKYIYIFAKHPKCCTLFHFSQSELDHRCKICSQETLHILLADVIKHLLFGMLISKVEKRAIKYRSIT